MVRENILDKNNYDKVLSSAFILNIIGVIFSVFLNNFINQNDEIYLLVVIVLGSILFRPFLVLAYFFQANTMLKFVSISNIIGLLIIGIYRIYLVYYEASLEMFAITYMVEQLLISLILVYFYIEKGFKIKIKLNIEYLKNIFNDSYPLLISGVFVVVFLKIDQVMIKELADFTEVGLYSIAVKVSSIWTVVPGIFIPNNYYCE